MSVVEKVATMAREAEKARTSGQRDLADMMDAAAMRLLLDNAIHA